MQAVAAPRSRPLEAGSVARRVRTAGGEGRAITGAAAGLGRVAAERFAAEGAVVVADAVDGSATVEAIAAAGGAATSVVCDVTDDEQVRQAVAAAVDTYGGLHVLYNNAGVMLGDDDDPVTTPIEVYERTMDINVKGVLLAAAATASRRCWPAAVRSSTWRRSSPTWERPRPDRLHGVEGRGAGDDAGDRRHVRPPGGACKRCAPDRS